MVVFQGIYEVQPFTLKVTKQYQDGDKGKNLDILDVRYTDASGSTLYEESEVVGATHKDYAEYFKTLRRRVARVHVNTNSLAHLTGLAEQEFISTMGYGCGYGENDD